MFAHSMPRATDIRDVSNLRSDIEVSRTRSDQMLVAMETGRPGLEPFSKPKNVISLPEQVFSPYA
jgi:hypothetical protein